MIKLYLYAPLTERKHIFRLHHYMNSKIWWSRLGDMNDTMEGSFQLQRASPPEILDSDYLLDAYLEAFQEIEKIKELENKGRSKILQPEKIFKSYRISQPQDLTKELLRVWLKDPNTERVFKKCETFFKANAELGAICFSKDPDSIPMWGHYARNGTGYCLEYELDIKKDINARYKTKEENGCFWYDFKLLAEEEIGEEGIVCFWVEKGNLTCKLKTLDGLIKTVVLSFKLKPDELTILYLKVYKDKIIKELTEKGLINRIAKSYIYPHSNDGKQIVILAEIKYEEKIPVLEEKEYFLRTAACDNGKNEEEKLINLIELFRYVGEHSFYVKSHDWAYEEEFRLISNINNKHIRGCLKPHGNYQFLTENFPLRLSGIIIGEKFGEGISEGKYKDVDRLKQYVLKKAKSKKLAVYSSEFNVSSDIYKMKRTLLQME